MHLIYKQYILISETFEEFINELYLENEKHNQQINKPKLISAYYSDDFMEAVKNFKVDNGYNS
jgi:hypothetical protein